MNKITKDNFTERLLAFQKNNSSFLDDSVKSVFHYTSIESLHSIIENDCLRLSDSRFLNDKRELKEGREATITAIEELLQDKYDKSSERGMILKEIKNYFESSNLHVYVASFLSEGELI